MTLNGTHPHAKCAACSFTDVVLSPGVVHSGDKRPDHDHGNNPGPWSRANRTATWLDIARALPTNLGVEFTAEHGWRIITLGVATRRALELLDIYEGDVIPDAAMRERRRHTTLAQLMLEQAQAVLRAEHADRLLARERVA